MAEGKMKWTEQQLRAIIARGSDVLVSASAGTGKTAVLSGRCVGIVSDKNLCPDVLSVLVLTFTEAAAEQMRTRIAEQLTDAFREKADTHLRQQLMLLQGADISTIHSFCKRLITEHFYKLGLDPTFRVIDSDEARLLKAEVLERTIDWAWQQSSLAPGLQQLFYRRDLRTVDGFLAKVIRLGDFLDGVVRRENWYERAIQLSEAMSPLTSGLGKKQKQIISRRLHHIHGQLRHAKRLYESQSADGGWTEICDDTFIKPVVHCIELLEAGDWDKFSEEIRNFERPPVRKPKGLSGLVGEIVAGTVRKAMDAFEQLMDLAILNPDYVDRVSAAVNLQTKVLVELVRKFDRLYGQAKQVVNCLDFADLEQYALKLLTGESSPDDKLLPSETALALQRRYKYIFVDEYQDINSVQQAILDLLSCGGNVFGVGDVKQSIYAWRGAEPDIFIEHLKAASVDRPDAQGGLRVDLNANFRSAKGILDFVNKVFSRIMTGSFARTDYDESAKLRPAISDKSKPTAAGESKAAVELHILDEDKTSQNHETNQVADEQNLKIISSRQQQAAMIAHRIRQMVGADTRKGEFQVYDKHQDIFRDVEYRDIVILMRSLAKKADFVEVFRLAGVPVACESVAGYFEATEISDLLCLLKVLDNPQRDIELAAVLRSPLFKISDTELAKIRIHNQAKDKYRSFYNCVLEYSACGPEAVLAEKLRNVLAQIECWRTLGRRGSLADLIWRIYRETCFLSFVCALPNGQSRRANLLKLHDRAIQFEGFVSSSGIASLTRFVEFVEKLQQVGQDWAPAEPDSSVENAVRVITVHKSKGLEFPVVFIAELDSKFNKRDIYDDCLADAGSTLGLQIIDRRSNTKLRSLAHQVIAEEKLSTALAEEMRILYVAMTRAKERLILTASQKKKHCQAIVSSGFFFGDRPIDDWQLRSCRSPLEWLLYGHCDQKSLHEAFETGLSAQAVDDTLFSMRLYEQKELQQISDHILKLKASKARLSRPRTGKLQPKRAGGKLLSQIKTSLAWHYQFGDAPALPTKRSVTQITHRNDEYVRIDYSRALERKPRVLLPSEDDLAGPTQGRLIGKATHLIIAQLDLTRPVTREAIEQMKEKLLVDGAIPEVVARHINTESIVKFFESELGHIIHDAENIVYREWPFTFAIPASEWKDTNGVRDTRCEIGDKIIVQGIIDMLVRTPAGLLVIDFKTDQVTESEVAERAELYRDQLEHYSRAASAIFNAKILGKWLYFLASGDAVEV